MEIFKTVITGIWDNVLNRNLTFGEYSFPIWVPSAMAIMGALLIRFLGGGKSE